ncbi:MAG: hypothetical protein KAW92_05920 [Candidatus Cloacimonetes bacterium]|nr:hypothetical protein [Candidatus Cloacimonadota bacterium]
MTAEIAIMNKEAVALAADSAVTMGQEGKWEQKVFTSANKLFTLSKYYPVGIMVYGSASFMGVPWQTIIKIYRSKLGKQKLDTLKEYADNFIAFLNNDNPLFPERQQKEYLYGNTSSYFALIRKEIEKRVKSTTDQEGEITNTQVKQITTNVIREHHNKLEKAKMLPSIPETHIEDIIKKYSDIIDKARKDVFEKLPISAVSLNQLRKISVSLFSKDIFPINISGAVIAGFGDKDTFPSLRSFDIEGIVNNKLKYKYNKHLSTEISFEMGSTIIPFAQREMVHTFMEGVDPDLQRYMEDSLFQIFGKYPKIIVENIGKFNDKEKQELLKKLEQVSNKIFKDYQKHMTIFRRNYYADPIMKVVAGLPKNELATMAETLVNLTLFKRKVSPEAETAAGPIDVAVISKGDGFIWIKRKHYFKSELNPQFFANYFTEVKDEKK